MGEFVVVVLYKDYYFIFRKEFDRKIEVTLG